MGDLISKGFGDGCCEAPHNHVVAGPAGIDREQIRRGLLRQELQSSAGQRLGAGRDEL